MPERTQPCSTGPHSNAGAAQRRVRPRARLAAWALWPVVVAWCATPALHAQTPQKNQAPEPQVERTVWVCDVAYTPTRSNWSRQVQLSYDRQRLRSVEIDQVRVYTFSVSETLILTSLDNERIRIDVGARTWTSDFRGLAEGQGRCEPLDAER